MEQPSRPREEHIISGGS